MAESKILEKARKRRGIMKGAKLEKDLREKRMEDLKYFTGEDQGWDKTGARSKLEGEKRPAITLNRINAIIRLISGNLPNTNTKYTAAEDGDVEASNIFTGTKAHIDRVNRWEFMRDDWFLRGVILMRWVLEIYRDYSVDPRGEVGFRMHDGGNFWFDPDCKQKDRSDATDMIFETSVDVEEAKRMFPGKETDVDQLVSLATSDGTQPKTEHDTQAVDEYADPATGYYDEASKRLSLNYYWYKEYHRKVYIIDFESQVQDPATGEMSPTVHESKKSYWETREDLKEFGDRFEVGMIDFKKVKYVCFAHDKIFEEGGHPFERKDGQPTALGQNFPFLAFEPERLYAGTHDALVSVLDPLKDPQMYHNKLSSMVLEIIGTQAHSGLDYEKGAIDELNEKKLNEHGAKPGTNIAWNRNAIAEGRVRPRVKGSPPIAPMQAGKDMSNELLDISAVQSLVNVESLGKGASGYAVDLKQRQGISVVAWIYNSFRFFEHILAEYCRDAIQATYTYEKVVRITGPKQRYVRINEQVFDYKGAVVQVLNDVTAGTFDAIVADQPLTPTLRLERLKQFVEMVKSGALQLPPPVMNKVFMELQDDPDLKEIVEEEMAAFQQAMQQQPEQQQEQQMEGMA